MRKKRTWTKEQKAALSKSMKASYTKRMLKKKHDEEEDAYSDHVNEAQDLYSAEYLQDAIVSSISSLLVGLDDEHRKQVLKKILNELL